MLIHKIHPKLIHQPCACNVGGTSPYLGHVILPRNFSCRNLTCPFGWHNQWLPKMTVRRRLSHKLQLQQADNSTARLMQVSCGPLRNWPAHPKYIKHLHLRVYQHCQRTCQLPVFRYVFLSFLLVILILDIIYIYYYY